METKSCPLLLQQKYQTTGRNSPKLGNCSPSLKSYVLAYYNKFIVVAKKGDQDES